MKKPKLLLLAAAGLLLACAVSGYVGWYSGIHSRAISRDAAMDIAAHFASGAPRSSRLDRSKGMPVWELNFADPGKISVTEVCVHALTGEIVGVRTESLHKANHELAEMAKHLGITAELLPSAPGKKPATAPPAEKIAPQKSEPPERTADNRE